MRYKHKRKISEKSSINFFLVNIHKSDNWKNYSLNPSRDVPEVVLNTKAVPIGLLLHLQIRSECPRVLSVNRDQTHCVSNPVPANNTTKCHFSTQPKDHSVYWSFLKSQKTCYILVYSSVHPSCRLTCYRFHVSICVTFKLQLFIFVASSLC